MRTRTKICGITRPEDGLAAAAAGADAIGLVFYAHSPRAVEIDRAREVLRVLPAFVTCVGLFVNAAPEHIHRVLEALPIDLLQFHGDEKPDDCRCFGRPYIKAIRMRPGIDLEREAEHYHDSRALLVDAYRPGVHGGTGAVFDWSRIPDRLPCPLILAGGLAPDNVAAAIDQVGPYGVDVSGGVEAAKGIKDHRLIEDFLGAVMQADALRLSKLFPYNHE